MTRVLVLVGHFRGDNPGRRRLVKAGVEVLDAPSGASRDEEGLVELLQGFDGVVAGTERYTEGVLQRCPQLKTIARWGVGVDGVDLEAAARLGVVVTNTPGLLVEAVADLAFALLLGVARRVREGDQKVRQGRWEGVQGRAVGGKTLGIVGVGAIGTAVARRGRGFGMELLGYDPVPRAEAEELGVKYVSLEELLKRSDFVTLHAPATEETRGMIGAAELAMMKPTAILVNTARGALVDQQALYEALRDGRLAGAGLDVFAEEPPAPDDPLLSLPNCLFTPHSGSNEVETVERINQQVAENLLEALGGGQPEFCVNPQVFGRQRR